MQTPSQRKQALRTYILSHGHYAGIDSFTNYLWARSCDGDKIIWQQCPTFAEVRTWLGY